MKSGASSASGGDMLVVNLCLEIMRLKIRAINETLQSMFLSHDLALGAIPIEEKIKLSSVRLCVRNSYVSKSATNQWRRQVW
jgi:hypothetical protein